MTKLSEKLAIGVDIGGSKLLVGLITENGTVIEKIQQPSGGLQSDPYELVRNIATAISELQRTTPGRGISCIGVGSAGQIDPSSGTVLFSPNLGWRNFPLKKELESTLRNPVLVVNDVQAIAWAERHLGAGKGFSDVLCVFVGTGVGGAIISNGELVSGYRGIAGEIGHTVLNHMGPVCRCGNFGCLEAYVGGWAIAQRVREAVLTQPEAADTLIRLVNGNLDSLDAASLAIANRSHDSLAMKLVAQIGNDLGLGISSAVSILDPQLVILGGGVIDGLERMIEIVEKQISSRDIENSANPIRVTKSKLGSLGGIIGAALWARKSLHLYTAT